MNQSTFIWEFLFHQKENLKIMLAYERRILLLQTFNFFEGVEYVFPPLSTPPGPFIARDWDLNGCEEKRSIGWHSLLSGCKVSAGTPCCCQFPHSWHLIIFHFHGCIFNFLRSQFFYWCDAVNPERSFCQRKIMFKKS